MHRLVELAEQYALRQSGDLGELRAENHLCGLSRQKLAEPLAHYYDALDYDHRPWEGNGWTQRAFWSRVARDAGAA